MIKILNTQKIVDNIIGKKTKKVRQEVDEIYREDIKIKIIELAKEQDGTVTAKEVRLKIPEVQKLHLHELELAHERGFPTPLFSAANKLIWELEKVGKLKSLCRYNNIKECTRAGSTIFKLIED